jgi:hypothetical protein
VDQQCSFVLVEPQPITQFVDLHDEKCNNFKYKHHDQFDDILDGFETYKDICFHS